LGGYRGFS